MNSQLATSRADLELAEAALREVLVSDFQHEAKADGTVLSHMLVHLVNMNVAIADSPGLHHNVVKRLGDFALTSTRMASRNPAATEKLERLADALRTASMRLNEWA